MSDNTPAVKTAQSNSANEVESVVKKSFETYARIKKEYSDIQLDYIIKTIAPTLNRDEVVLFIIRCESLGIDPMSGDITAYVSIDKKNNRKLTMIVARNWKRERGMSNPHVKSIKTEAIYVKEETETANIYDAGAVTTDLKSSKPAITSTTKKSLVRVQPWEGGTLWGAVCTIVRDDYNLPFSLVAPLAEYKGWNVWETKPSTMIKKVAESQCWDLAIPELSRVYDESERFDGEKSSTIEGGSDPATPEQIETIKTLLKSKGKENEIEEMPKEMTKQEAVDNIKNLTKKG